MKKGLLFLALFAGVLFSCNKASVLETLPATDIRATKATLNAKINKDAINDFDILYSDTAKTVEDLKSNGSSEKEEIDSDGLVTCDLNELRANTTYYYVIVAKTQRNKNVYGEVMSFTTKDFTDFANNGEVDLGLSVKWAVSNLSASGLCARPEEYGDYYAWGEIEPKSSYSWAEYKHYGPRGKYGIRGFTKYNANKYAGTVDNKKLLESKDDAAKMILGDNWRIPTSEEWTELLTKCTVEGTQLNGIYGYEVVGPNGNSIFFPSPGRRYDTGLEDEGDYGYYWSSSLMTDDPKIAWYVKFGYRGAISEYDYYRINGFSIRPVSE